jgi:hypothetical protein
MFFLVPVVFLGAIHITAGLGVISINLYFPGEMLRVLLTVRNVCLVFGAAGVCGFLSAYYALVMFQQPFEYFRFCVFEGLHPAEYLAGRFGMLTMLLTVFAACTTALTGLLVPLTHPEVVFSGYLLLGIIYGALGGIIGTISRDFLVGFLSVAILADLDVAWLQNPVYYTAGQDLDLVRWLPAFYPCQLVFAGAFTEDTNILAVWGSCTYAAASLVLFLVSIASRLWRVRRIRTAHPEGGES